MSRKMILLRGLTVAMTMAVTGCAAHANQGFTFRDAAFMQGGKGMAAAQAFVAAQLPVGLSLTQAEARLTDAGMACKTEPASSAATVCEYYILAGGDGGTLGDDFWTVRLQTDAQARLVSAALDRSRSGFSAQGAN